MKRLTTAEEEIMQILWDLKAAVVKEIVDHMPDPKPAYNTVSTVVRILEKKGYLDHKVYGKTFMYIPVVTKREYARSYLSSFLKNYFNNSFPKLASFFAKENDLTLKELEELIKMAEKEQEKEKN
jgi:BlaI family transcriptional regulator, penicillinase repressor